MAKKPRAMVLAAGIGSRLAPLSDDIPKPLIRIGGRSVIEHIILLLKKHGFNEIISNTYHLAEQIHEELDRIAKEENLHIQYRQEKELSGVAGGIRFCKDFLESDTCVILMGDALTDVNLTALYEKHQVAVKEHGCIVTIAQKQVEDTSQFGVIVTESLLEGANPDSKTANKVVNFQEKPATKEALSNWANTGIYFFEAKVFDYIPDAAEAAKFDVAKDLFPRILEAGEYMQAVAVEKEMYWADIGTPDQYLQSVKDIKEGKVKLDLKPAIAKSAQIATSAKLEGANEVGEDCQIEADALIKNCILWDSVTVEAGSQLENCILGSKTIVRAGSKLKNSILVSHTEGSSRLKNKTRTGFFSRYAPSE